MLNKCFYHVCVETLCVVPLDVSKIIHVVAMIGATLSVTTEASDAKLRPVVVNAVGDTTVMFFDEPLLQCVCHAAAGTSLSLAAMALGIQLIELKLWQRGGGGPSLLQLATT